MYKKEKNVIKDLIKDMPVSIMFDETPDAEGRCVLNIMVSPLVKDESGKIRSYLVDTFPRQMQSFNRGKCSSKYFLE